MSPALVILLVASAGMAPDTSLAIPGYDVRVEHLGAASVRLAGSEDLVVAPGSPILHPRAAERAARALRRFVFGHPGVFGIDPQVDDLTVLATARVGEHSWIHFSQQHLGRPVITDACVGFVSFDGKVEALLTDFAVLGDDPGHAMSADDAIAVAVRRHPSDPGAMPSAETPRYCRVGESWHFVHVVQLPSTRAWGRRLTVDAFTGEVLSDSRMFPSDPR